MSRKVLVLPFTVVPRCGLHHHSVYCSQVLALLPALAAAAGMPNHSQRWQSLFSHKCVLLRVRNRSARRRAPEPAAVTLPAAAVVWHANAPQQAALESVQHQILSSITGCPNTTSTHILRIETGCRSFESWADQRKLEYVFLQASGDARWPFA
jgi:hypothetical protein